MRLSFLDRERPIAITDIALAPEKQHSHRLFYPPEDVSSTDWEGIEYTLKRHAERGNFIDFGTFHGYATVLNKDRVDSLSGIPWSTIYDQLKMYYLGKNDFPNANALLNFSIFALAYPALAHGVIVTNEKLKKYLEYYLEIKPHREGTLTDAATFAAGTIINALGFDIPLSTDKLHHHIALAAAPYWENQVSLGLYLKLKALDRIIFPDEFAPIPAHQWNRLREWLEEDVTDYLKNGLREEGYIRFLEEATWLTVLSADKIILNRNGIETIFYDGQQKTSDVKQKESPPLQRSF